MKKLLTLCLMVFMCVALGDMLMPQEAQALMPLACTTAMDYGWRNYGWNVLCVWHLQMEQGYYEGPDDGYSVITPRTEIILDQKTYAMSAVQWQRIRYPIRA